MGLLIIGVMVIVVAVVALNTFSRSSARSEKDSSGPRGKSKSQERLDLERPSAASGGAADTVREIRDHFEQEIAWLRARWAERARSKEAGEPQEPVWWWDAPTDPQLKRLREGLGALRHRGMDFGFSPLTKGAASDLIGIEEDVEESDAEVLKFFKAKLEPSNQTRARYTVRQLFKDPANRQAWDSRPATREQIAVVRVMGVEVPKGLTAKAVLELRNDTLKRLIRTDDPRASEAQAYEALIETFMDKEECHARELKAPGWKLLNEALDALRAGGLTYEAIRDDDDVVDQKLLELRPSLQRASDE